MTLGHNLTSPVREKKVSIENFLLKPTEWTITKKFLAGPLYRLFQNDFVSIPTQKDSCNCHYLDNVNAGFQFNSLNFYDVAICIHEVIGVSHGPDPHIDNLVEESGDDVAPVKAEMNSVRELSGAKVSQRQVVFVVHFDGAVLEADDDLALVAFDVEYFGLPVAALN